MPGHVNEREEQVTELPGQRRGSRTFLPAGIDLVQDLFHLFPHLGQSAGCIRPVKAFMACLFLQRLRPQQGWKRTRNAIERALAFRLLRLLQLLPQSHRFRGIAHGAVAKDMRVPADQFLRQGAGDVREFEVALFLRDLRLKDDMEQKIAQFLEQMGGGPGRRWLPAPHGIPPAIAA